MTNKILFGSIGFLMFAIAGIGVAEVSHGFRARSGSDTAITSEAGNSDSTGRRDDSSQTVAQTAEIRPSAGVTGSVGGRYSDDADNNDEENDEDEDDGGARGSAGTSVSASGRVAALSGSTQGTQASAGPAQSSAGGYTMAQVAAHKTSSSCWTVVNGNVYDVTAWIGQHPGGANAILSMCGKDGSAAFNGQHGGQARPASELASFKIGVLK